MYGGGGAGHRTVAERWRIEDVSRKHTVPVAEEKEALGLSVMEGSDVLDLLIVGGEAVLQHVLALIIEPHAVEIAGVSQLASRTRVRQIHDVEKYHRCRVNGEAAAVGAVTRILALRRATCQAVDRALLRGDVVLEGGGGALIADGRHG